MAELSDEELMAAYVAGDRRAFEALFRRYSPVLYGMARRQLRSEELARDLVQQTFLHMHRARADFRAGARLKPWLFTIATNLVREHFRRVGRRPETSYEAAREEAPSLEPAEAPVDLAELEAARLDVRRLRDALGRLPENQRLVIELHWIQGHPFSEVAEMVGASVSAVKVRAHRGYQRLRTLVAAARDAEGPIRRRGGGDA
jgi:RNA polymerase sigma-70 factor (ECF subfamily)